MVHVLSTGNNLAISRCSFIEDGNKKVSSARAEFMFCSLKRLLSDVTVTVAMAV